ncbi:MAG: hypothetical protein M1282_13570, partial [Chloroflexi bacterium]|nr:hypothetical protein [Chloroflexota bacterium]
RSSAIVKRSAIRPSKKPVRGHYAYPCVLSVFHLAGGCLAPASYRTYDIFTETPLAVQSHVHVCGISHGILVYEPVF